MKILLRSALAAGVLALTACGGGADDQAAENVEAAADNQADMLEAQADNTTNSRLDRRSLPISDPRSVPSSAPVVASAR